MRGYWDILRPCRRPFLLSLCLVLLTACGGSFDLRFLDCIPLGCPGDGDPSPGTPPATPKDAESQYSILGFGGQIGATVYTGSVNAVLVVRQGTATTETEFGGATFFLGGYSSNPDSIDVAYFNTGAGDQDFAFPVGDLRVWGINVGSRLDEAGGATDVFAVEIEQDFFDANRSPLHRDPGILTIYNTDGTGGSGSPYVALITWEGTQEGFVMSDGTVIPDALLYGATAIGSGTGPFAWDGPSSTATYTGSMRGLYFDGADLTGTSGVTVIIADFDTGAFEGRISDIQAGSVTLHDIVLAGDGSAFSDLSVEGQTGASMSGTYDARLMGPQAEAIGGSVAVTDGTSGLVGAFEAER